MFVAINGYCNKIAIGQFYCRFTHFRNLMSSFPAAVFRPEKGFKENRDSDASAGDRPSQETMLNISRTDYIIHTSGRPYTTNHGKRKQN
jgi:hypothetical protein